MNVDVKVPEVGESITEGLLVEWTASEGELVGVDDELFVLETDKITMAVNAEHGGQLKIMVEAGETVAVGQVVATIDTAALADPTASTADASADTPPLVPGEAVVAEPAAAKVEPPLIPGEVVPTEAPTHVGALGGEPLEGLAPAVQRLVLEHGLDASQLVGTGKDGRLTKEDVLRHLEQGGAATPAPVAQREPGPEPEAPPAAEPAPAPETVQPPVKESAANAVEVPKPQPPQTRRPFSPLRQRVAERLVQVQQSAAILTTFNEADMGRVMELRRSYRPLFKERLGVDLGFMSFFVKATVDALKAVPQVNAFIDGDEIVDNHYYDIGVAVSTDKGLVVPVLRRADELSMAEIERQIADLARRAAERRLELSDLSGGVFTISNGGVFGSMLSTPILNPPQSAILGMHAIKKRPVVVDDEIVIRPMMYLALSYDHRLIDGREAVTFLRRIVECIEDPERMLLEV